MIATSQEMLALVDKMRADLKLLIEYSNAKGYNRGIAYENWKLFKTYCEMLERVRTDLLGIKRPS